MSIARTGEVVTDFMVPPDADDGFSRKSGLPANGFTFNILQPDGTVLTGTALADDDRPSGQVLAGQVLVVERGVGNYYARWRVGVSGAGAPIPGIWRLDIDWPGGSQRWFTEHQVARVVRDDAFADVIQPQFFRVDRVFTSFFTPDDLTDGFTRVAGLTATNWSAEILAPDGVVVTSLINDDDRADSAIVRGQVLVKEVGSGNYRFRWRIGRAADSSFQPGKWRLTVENATHKLRAFEEVDTSRAPEDNVARYPVVIQARQPGGTAVPGAAFTIKDSGGAVVAAGYTDSAGDAQVFLLVAAGYNLAVQRDDLAWAAVTFTAPTGGATVTATSKHGSVNVLAVDRVVTTTGQAQVLLVEFRNKVTNLLVDPLTVDKVEVLDTNGSTILETITGAAITKVSTGRYQVTAASGNLDTAGVYSDKWTYTLNSGDPQVAATLTFVVSTAVTAGLPLADLCTITGSFTNSQGGPLAGVPVRFEQSGLTTKSNKVLPGTTITVQTTAAGAVSVQLARNASVKIQIWRTGLDKTFTVPDLATADLSTLL